jgi:hypothetical protein
VSASLFPANLTNLKGSGFRVPNPSLLKACARYCLYQPGSALDSCWQD